MRTLNTKHVQVFQKRLEYHLQDVDYLKFDFYSENMFHFVSKTEGLRIDLAIHTEDLNVSFFDKNRVEDLLYLFKKGKFEIGYSKLVVKEAGESIKVIYKNN